MSLAHGFCFAGAFLAWWHSVFLAVLGACFGKPLARTWTIANLKNTGLGADGLSILRLIVVIYLLLTSVHFLATCAIHCSALPVF